MILRDETILRLIRDEVRRLRQAVADAGQRYQLDTIDAGLHELALRGDGRFQSGHYRQGTALAREGVALAAGNAASLGELPAEVPEVSAPDAFAQSLLALQGRLQAVVKVLGVADAAGDPRVRDYLRRVVDWECALGARRAAITAAPAGTPAGHRYSRENVERYLREKFPHRPNLRIVEFDLLAGGYSKMTILLSTIDDSEGRVDMVIRANLPVPNMRIEGADVRNEYPLLEMAWATGLPVAEPLWLETDESLLGTSFAVCRRALGRTLGSHTSGTGNAMTPAIKADILRVLRKIHDIPADPDSPLVRGSHLAHWAAYRDYRSVAIATVDYWMEDIARYGAAVTPSLQRLYDWLIANAPDAEPFRPVFIHGDYGVHNILIDGERVSAVLDWEIAKIGDPAEEFVPFFFTTGVEYDEAAIADYVAAGGQHVSRFRVCYYVLVIVMRSLIFDTCALGNLARNPDVSMNVLHWLTAGPSYPLMSRINALIARAEEVRAQYGS